MDTNKLKGVCNTWGTIKRTEQEEELLRLENEFLECGYTQEVINEIKGTGDIEDQIDNLYGEQEAWTDEGEVQ